MTFMRKTPDEGRHVELRFQIQTGACVYVVVEPQIAQPRQNMEADGRG
jgi:hypothetical protein